MKAFLKPVKSLSELIWAKKQYELDTWFAVHRFPLDAVPLRNFSFSSGMATIKTNSATQTGHGLAMRLIFGVAGGWRRWATVAAAVLAMGLAYHVVFGQNGLTAYQRKMQDARHLEKQLQSLQHENEMLKSHIDRLKDDPNAIEHQAREDLHYTRPGEVIYTLPAAPVASSAAVQGSR